MKCQEPGSQTSVARIKRCEYYGDLQEIVRDPGHRTLRACGRLRERTRGPAPSPRSEIDSCSTCVLAYGTGKVSVYDTAADPASVDPIRWRASSLSFRMNSVQQRPETRNQFAEPAYNHRSHEDSMCRILFLACPTPLGAPCGRRGAPLARTPQPANGN